MYRIRVWNDDDADDFKVYDHEELRSGLAIEGDFGWDIIPFCDFDYYEVL